MLRLWFIAFLLTLAIECPIAVALLRRADRPARLFGLAFFANLATHPSVWFVFPELGLPRPVWLTLAEAFAFLAEAAFFRLTVPRAGWRLAVIAALAANATSYVLGRQLFQWLL